jgi:hypothetical protein
MNILYVHTISINVSKKTNLTSLEIHKVNVSLFVDKYVISRWNNS